MDFRLRRQQTASKKSKSQPSFAWLMCFKYSAPYPRPYFAGGCCQLARRWSNTWSLTSSVSRRPATSSSMTSPVCTRASGPRRTTPARRAERRRRSWCRSSARRRYAPCRERPAPATSWGSATAPTRAFREPPVDRRSSTPAPSSHPPRGRDHRSARPSRRSSRTPRPGRNACAAEVRQPEVDHRPIWGQVAEQHGESVRGDDEGFPFIGSHRR